MYLPDAVYRDPRTSGDHDHERLPRQLDQLRITNETRGAVIADRAFEAQSYWSRLVGLLSRSSLEPGEALHINPCTSVHTAFMRFPIDVIYLNRDNEVVKLSPNLKPFRMSGILRGGHSVVELPTGVIESTGTTVGDRFTIEREPVDQ